MVEIHPRPRRPSSREDAAPDKPPVRPGFEPGRTGEDPPAMRHFSCDVCGKDMTPANAQRYVVTMEAFAAADPAALTEDDLDADHVEEMAQLLNAMEESGATASPTPARQSLRFDLCAGCYRKFLTDPLGRDSAAKFDFSEN